ncbi:MAG TPA: hypothetical protein VJR04_05355 [Terriglobales bacterium]|nr:hypothetical protein [Terriglobales bacterium]
MSIHPRVVSMKQVLFFVVSATLLWSACGSKKSTPTTGVTVTISPTTASVAGGATQQFMATVTGSTNTAVTWQVNGENGGDALIGTITSAGLYTAPNVLPSTTTVIITATSQADTTKSASATVTLTAPAVTISINPPSVTLAAGATQPFTPTITVTGSTNNAVNWSVNGVQGGDAIHGTIDTNGLYTAPLSPPRAGITVTATSQANTAFSASAPVTVQFGNASLNGTYVFFASRPDDSSGTGFFYRAGTFIADGQGNIKGGINDASAGSAGTLGSGSYSIGADGRGSLTFADDGGTHKFAFSLTSNTRGQLIGFDTGLAISGFIRQQDPTAASAAPSGSYVFGLSGDNLGPAAAVGQITFGSTVTGTEDSNTNGTVMTGTGLTGSMNVGTGGRGTLQLNTSNFAVYIIDASTLVLVDIDAAGARLAGTAYAQSGTFTTASLGTSAYLLSGVTSGTAPQAYGQAGRFDTNNAGGFRGGVFDSNTAGASPVVNSPFGSSAAYTLDSTGRGTISNGTSNFIFWLASPKQGVILQSDPGNVATGLILQQQIGIPSVTGGFALANSGTDATGATDQASDAQLTIAAFGQSSGTQDINLGGTTTPSSSPVSGASVTISNTSTERGTASIGGAFNVYFVTADRFLMLSSAPTAPVLSGGAERQCSDCTF